MSHPYASYIEATAAEYFSRQKHESLCKTLQPYRPPTAANGETYDVYIIQHCDCWLVHDLHTLSLAEKFAALRDLSHRYPDLHSGACTRFKKTPITYRNKPEYLTYPCNCWLSVLMRNDPDHACPACFKPLYHAPNAPKDSAKWACSDPECENAHGLDSPVDIRFKSLVDYKHQPQTKEKEHTMSDLHIAKHRAEAAEQAQRDIDNFLAPFVKKFAELHIKELQTRGFDHRDANATRFTEIDGSHFGMTGEETYEYGETYTPSLNIPFDFVEDPGAYRQKALAEKVEREEKAALKKKKDAEERVASLKAQLAKAEADIKAADAERDAIKFLANRHRAKSLRNELAQNEDQG